MLPNAFYTSCSTLDLQSLWQSTHAWAYVEKRALDIMAFSDLQNTFVRH